MNFLLPLAILAVIIASSECYRIDPLEESINNDRIVGGKTAQPAQFPYMVSLRNLAKLNCSSDVVTWNHRCGGSILNTRWILSAAQCTQNEYSKSSKLVIVVGAHHIQNDGKLYGLDRIVNHPAFNNQNYRYDICLLRTNKTIQFNDFVQPIALRKQFVGAGVAATVSGWGWTRYPVTGPERSIRLQFLEVNTWTNLECLKRHSMPEWFRFYNGTLCAFARAGQGVCHGDSGSPLVASRQIIGFAVWERPCGRGVPDGYTRVSEFSGWIREVSGIVAV